LADYPEKRRFTMTIIQKTLDIDASMQKVIGLFTEPEKLSMSKHSREKVTCR